MSRYSRLDCDKQKSIADSTPYFKYLKKNGYVIIPSLYLFKKSTEFWVFLHACDVMNCTVLFKNENFTYIPKDKDNHTDAATNLSLILKMSLIDNPDMITEYMRFCANHCEMGWDKVISLDKEDCNNVLQTMSSEI